MGQLIEFPFATGIDQRTRPEYVDGSQSWLTLENIRARKAGGGDKRYGFSVYDTGTRMSGSRTAGRRMFVDARGLVTTDGSTLDAYSGAAAVSTSRGRLPEASMRIIDMPTPSLVTYAEDVEYCNGYLCTVSLGITAAGTYSVIATVTDATTGAIVKGPESVNSSGFSGIVCSYGVYFMYLKYTPGTTTLDVMYLDTTNATTIAAGWTAAGGSVSAAVNNSFGNIAACSMSDRIAIAFKLSAGTNRLGIKTWNIAGQVESTTVNTSSVTPGAVDICIGDTADTLWAAWSETTTIKAIGLTPTSLASVLGTTGTLVNTTASDCIPRIAAASTTASTARLLTLDTDSDGSFSWSTSFTITAGAVVTTGSANIYPGLQFAGRPFSRSDRFYCHMAEYNNYTSYLVDFTEDVDWVRPVLAVEPSLPTVSWLAISKVVTTSSGKRYMTHNVKRSSVVYASRLIEIDFTSTDLWQPAVFGNSTYLSGGVLGYFDGVRFTEAGFLYRPKKPVTSTSGTGVTFTTGVRYVAVFESVDADGNLVWSGVSDPSDALTCSNKTVSVKTQAMAATYRMESGGLSLSPLRVVIYRTLDNGGTPPYYRVGVVDNTTSQTVVTYSDTTTDTTLASNAKLYTQPGILGAAQDRRAMPGPLAIVSFNGMLVGCVGNTLWHSGQPVAGEAAWFNPIFQVPVEGEGDITALAVQDGTLFAFKRTGIWAVSGEPPSDNGASGGLGAPRRLAVDVGCISQRSVVTTSLGTFFQSERGLEMLTRAQSVEWVGEAVQDEIVARPYIMAATVDHVESLVYFELSSGLTSGVVSGTGRGLVYDLSLRKWISTDRRTNNAGTADTPAQSACMVYNGTDWAYAWLGADGKVYRETSSYLDPNSAWVTKAAESAWAKGPGTQATMRLENVKLLAKYATDSNVAVSLAYDYATSFQSARTFTRSEIAALAAGTGGAGTMPNVHLQHDGHDDGGQTMAVRARIADATPTGGTVGTGQGAVWTGLAFEVTPMEGGYELPDGAR